MDVAVATAGMQVVLVEWAGPLMDTTPMSLGRWAATVGIGSTTLLVGALCLVLYCDLVRTSVRDGLSASFFH